MGNGAATYLPLRVNPRLRQWHIIKIIVVETSFPLFLVLTWLLPAHFLRRYLQKLKPREVEGEKISREIALGGLKRIELSLALIIVLCIALWYSFFGGAR